MPQTVIAGAIVSIPKTARLARIESAFCRRLVCINRSPSQQKERARQPAPFYFAVLMKWRLSTRYLMPEMAVTAATSQHRALEIRQTAMVSVGPARAAAK